ncbi:MAG: hypothetical protein AMXMBFR13_37520 [Phycisphaerae bacterium]
MGLSFYKAIYRIGLDGSLRHIIDSVDFPHTYITLDVSPWTGDIYVGRDNMELSGGDRVRVFHSDGTFVGSGPSTGWLRGLAFSSNGDIYAADQGQNIFRMCSDGHRYGPF